MTAVGAASLNAATSDNSDASYADMTGAAADSVTFSLGTVSLPAGAVTKSVTVRHRGSVAGCVVTSALYLPAGGTPIAQVSTTMAAGIATYAGTLVAVTLTQADIDGLQLFVIKSVAAGRLHEEYVDLVYATVPVVTPSAPTGVQATPTPTMLWTYAAGSDGDVQSRYQIRVFTAAQYGIGGFDPATSPASYDSGTVLGAATSAVLGVLPNSSTMRAYVNVAQTINGTPQWSGWSYSAFTTSFTTSNVTSIVGTADATNARITLLVTRNGATPTWTKLEVQRSDDGGATWGYIRGGKNIAVSGATWPLNDYETANGASALYRARATYIASGVTITGAWVTSSAVSWTSTSDWLKDVNIPARNVKVCIRRHPDLTYGRTQGVNGVVGRTDPVVISDVQRLATGSIAFHTDTHVASAALILLLSTDVVLLQTVPGNRFGSKYLAVGAVTETAPDAVGETSQDRYFGFGFVQVLAPTDISP